MSRLSVIAGLLCVFAAASAHGEPLCKLNVGGVSRTAGPVVAKGKSRHPAPRSRPAPPVSALEPSDAGARNASPDPLEDAIAHGQGVDLAELARGPCAAASGGALESLRQPSPPAMRVNDQPAVGFSAEGGHPQLTLVASDAVRAHLKLRSSGARVDFDVALFRP